MKMKAALLRQSLIVLLTLIFSITSFSQTSLVSGRVTGSTAEPLAGVTIKVKGGNTTSTSNPDGTFQINVPSQTSTLVFTYVGYGDLEVPVNKRSQLSVQMTINNASLENVVVIGYGTQKRKNVTGSVASFDARKLDERPVQRIDQALVGQLSGVTVKQNTGVPGKAFSVQVRGSGSITAGNEPLYVIDGFPLSNNSSNTGNGSYTGGNPLDNINPDDIENIQVLKDAAAAAIYGSRASNGVVLITTKHGQSGRPKITVNSSVGYNEASKKLKMLNGEQWIDRATEMINAAYVLKAGAFGATTADDAATRRAKLTLAGIPLSGTQINTAYMIDPRWMIPGHPGLESEDWQSIIEQKGLMQNNEIAASGGTDVVKYFISGNYINQDGFVKGLSYKAYSVRANVDINVSKNFKIGLNVSPTFSITKDPGVEGKDNIFHQALSMSPIQEDSVGLYPNVGKNAQYLWSNTTNGLLGKLENIIGESKRYRTIGTIYGEYQIIKGLAFRTSINLDNTDNSTRGYTPYIVTGSQTTRTFNAASNTNLTSGTSGNFSTYRRQTFVNENTLTFNKVFNEHSFNILLGQSYNYDRLDQSTMSSVGGYTSSVIQTLNYAAGVTGNTQSGQNVLISYFSRLQYAYADKYLFAASLRSDASSRFGVNNQYGTFPSASIGWRAIEEDFMKKQNTFSNLMLRASYGVNGNNNIGNYPSIPTLGTSGYVFGSTQVGAIGQAPNVIANPDIHWEKSQTLDLGIDMGFLKNRISASFDYYNKKNTDLLLFVQIPEVTGFSSYLTNIGAVRNIGEELEISTRNITGQFQWNTNLNVSHNANKILALAPGQTQIIIPNGFDVSDQILRVGQPLNSIYVVKQIGILTQEDITKKAALYGTGETIGDPKYQDLNGDGVITEADKQIVGHANPDYTWGITNTFRYKGFDLSVLVQGQNGGSIYSLLGRAITRTGQGFTDNAPAFYVNRWKSPTDQGDGRVSKAYSTFGFVANTDWLYSSDYVRVRNITLGYNLKGIIKTSALQGARVYLSIENFFGHDKYYGGLNPEAANTTISSNSAYPEAGDYGGLPLAKSLIFGVNLTF